MNRELLQWFMTMCTVHITLHSVYRDGTCQYTHQCHNFGDKSEFLIPESNGQKNKRRNLQKDFSNLFVVVVIFCLFLAL